MTGVTTFMLDKDIDMGGIILRQEYRISPEDTAGTLHDKLMEIGAQLVVETTEGIFQHNVETRIQRSFIQGSEVLRSAPKLTKENTRIDWSASAANIYNLVRGLSPYPAAWTTLATEGKEPVECKIFFGKAFSSEEMGAGDGFAATGGIASDGAVAGFSNGTAEAGISDKTPGTIASDGKTYLAVATGDGWFMVSDLQLAGKKRMAVDDFLRGWRNPEAYKAV